MSTVNPLAREISAKIVYCGPALSGKTTSLKRIYDFVRPQRRGQLVTLATQGDRTIFFDFLPLSVKEVRGFSVRFLLYTVPGQTFYAATRELVLKGADGVVFVVDSSPSAEEANRASLDELGRFVAAMGLDFERLPIVFQWNKRDLPDRLPLAQLARLNRWGAPAVETCALDGRGVLAGFKAVSRQVLRRLWLEGGVSPGAEESDPGPMPDDAPPRASQLATEADVSAEEEREGPPVAAALRGFGASASDSIEAELKSLMARRRESTHRPSGRVGALGYSFAPLFPEDEAVELVTVETALAQGLFAQAVHVAASAVASLLDALPGIPSAEGHGVRAQLLGLDGRDYLRLSRLASLPEGSITERDALFALHLLVGARLRANALVGA